MKKIYLSIFLVATLMIITYTGSINAMGNEEAKPAAAINESYMTIIAHAGGVVDGRSASNSREAIEQSYKKGCRFIELDFNWTKDGGLALIHDWDQMGRFCPGLPKKKIPTLAEFENCRIAGKYESMTWRKLAIWLKAHPDVCVITDVKRNNVKALKLIKQSNPEIIRQIIPQIYSKGEYAKVKALGYDRIILTLYRMKSRERRDTDNIIRFAKKNRLYAVTMDKVMFDLINDEEKYVKNGIKVYAYTVNDPDEAAALKRKGVSGIYSDKLSPNAFRQKN